MAAGSSSMYERSSPNSSQTGMHVTSSSSGDFSIPGGRPLELPSLRTRPTSSLSSSTFSKTNSRMAKTGTPMGKPNSARTPGSTSSCLTSLSALSNVVMALVEGRGLARGEIGVASMDLTFPILKVTQFSDSQSYIKLLNKLEVDQPVALLLPSTMSPNSGSSNDLLLEAITDTTRATINFFQRRYFSEALGSQYVKQLCLADSSQTVQLQLQNKYYALAAIAALIKYAEHIQNVVFAPSSLKIEYVGCEQIMFVESRTAKYLELMENLNDPESDKTLYGVMNYTATFGGMRLLRANILQPPFDLATVTQRLLAVSELVSPEHEQLLTDLRSLLSRWPDVERVFTLFVHKRREGIEETKKAMMHRINQFNILKQITESVTALHNALARCSSPIFIACRALVDLDSFTELRNQLLDVLNDEVPLQKGRQGQMVPTAMLLVKEGVYEILDVCRQAYEEVMSDIRKCVSELAIKYSIPLRLANNNIRGFHIQLPASACKATSYSEKSSTPSRDRRLPAGSISVTSSPASTTSSSRLPPEFVRIARWRGLILCSTNYLVSLNNRCQEAENEVLKQTNDVLLLLREKLQPFIPCLYKLAESVAIVDMLVSLAEASLAGEYVCPRFESVLALKKSRHPILDRFVPHAVVPNDCFAEPGSNFVLITGPNMAGKSTFLKQIATIQIMAQVGCFVPASFASLRLVDRLFTRLDINDDIETNLSSFMLEIREMSYILANITPNSLVIIDEFARTTSPDEGLGISFAACEELLMSKAYTFFATHFAALGLLASLYPNVDTQCFELEPSHSSLSMIGSDNNPPSSTQAVTFDQPTSDPMSNIGRLSVTHRLRSGVVQTTHYGVKLVEMTLMPREIVDEAKVHIKRLDALHTRQRRVMEQNSVNDVRLAKLRLVSLLLRIARHVDADRSNFNVIRERMVKLKADFAPILVVP